jgi:type I restriction enzyme, R subunit
LGQSAWPGYPSLAERASTGRKEPELDRLSNILKAFNDQFGNKERTDSDRIRKLVTEEIPSKVSADKAYQKAKEAFG